MFRQIANEQHNEFILLLNYNVKLDMYPNSETDADIALGQQPQNQIDVSGTSV